MGGAEVKALGLWLVMSMAAYADAAAQTPVSAVAAGQPPTKCAYLRGRVREFGEARQAYADSVTQPAPADSLGVVDTAQALATWMLVVAREAQFDAKERLARLAFQSCKSGIALLDPARQVDIEAARAKQVDETRKRWLAYLNGSPDSGLEELVVGINAAYDAEQRSFGAITVGRTYIDPDVAKEFPDLSELVRSSPLDAATQAQLIEAIPLMQFAEAGTLNAVLNGSDSTQGLAYAYRLRPILAARVTDRADSTDAVARAASEEQAALVQENDQRRTALMTQSVVGIAVLVVLLIVLWIFASKYLARVRAFKTGAKRMPYWGGAAEWVLWDPGETVVLLRQKVLVPIEVKRTEGGIGTISAWRGEEYRGRISSKTQLFAWRSEPILTADGLPIYFSLSIWWRVNDPQQYVSRIAAEYRADGETQQDSLMGAAGTWLEKFAAGTLREQVSKLPAARVISARAERFLEVEADPGIPLLGDSAGTGQSSFAQEIAATRQSINTKTADYGIEVERIEVQGVELPPEFQETIEEMRRAYIEPGKARLESEAAAIRANRQTDVEMGRLARLAEIIGAPAVATKEILKDVDLAGLANPLVVMNPVMTPFTDAVRKSAETGLKPIQPAEEPRKELSDGGAKEEAPK